MRRFVLSLDFELLWGVVDSDRYALYRSWVQQVPFIVDNLLYLFDRFNIRATWATVGLMMCESKEEMLLRLPKQNPGFKDPKLDVRRYINEFVGDTQDDTCHYGMSLIRRIINCTGQEIGSHSFSHFNCLEPMLGDPKCSFEADLDAMRDISHDRGIDLNSFVFCRNQYNDDFVDCLANFGYKIYRSSIWDRSSKIHLGHRLYRRMSSYLPINIDSELDIRVEKNSNQILNHRESFFFVVHSNRTLQKIHNYTLLRKLNAALVNGRDFHLWFHPWNLGKDVNNGIESLTEIFAEIADLSSRYSVKSVNMGDLIVS